MPETDVTFKQPFLGAVTKALENAVSISWDGCHKIYITLDEASHQRQIDWGYEPEPVTDKEEALATLFSWFDVSCGLRFIDAVSSDAGFDDVIAQFDYDDEDTE